MNEEKKEFIRTSIVVFLWLVALLFIFISPYSYCDLLISYR
ncbi:Uncharacterised protein [Pasteurella canis]|nr:Uncharacterised protein [Pasteurella canis]